MPTYGYRCGSCGHEFEIRQKITDEPLKVCPVCQGKLSKMVYPAGVIFTGSGYYTTDYKSSGKGEGAASSNGEGSGSESSSDSKSKTETKSESSSESKSDSKSESKSESKAGAKPESKSNSKTEKAS
jgi:putative FmdB family regulatory protein